MAPVSLPDRSQVVIIGGGVVGCSIAYHLAQRGVADVVLIERRQLTHGSTWHAAGLVGQLRTSSSLTQLMRTSVETYETLEGLTGYATGWHGVGSLRVASSPDRWEEIKPPRDDRARASTSTSQLVSPTEAKALFPLLNTDGVFGASWIPSDGYADPSQLTHSFATGARAAGVRIVQDCRVTAIERAGRRVVAVDTTLGRIECDTLVNATGMWGAETARLAGVDLAVNAVEHQYVVTEKSDDIAARSADPARPGRPLLPQARGRRPGDRRVGARHPRSVGARADPARPRPGAVRARTTSASRGSPKGRRTDCPASANSASRRGSTGRSRSRPTPSR